MAKLLNKDGKFDFVKNGQVEINRKLKKYSGIGNAISENNSATNILISGLNNGSKNEHETKDFVVNAGEEEISMFCFSPTAKEFNKEFEDVLKMELNRNNYSIGVGQSNIIEYSSELKEKKGSFLKKVFENIKKCGENIKNDILSKKEPVLVIDFLNSLHIDIDKVDPFVNRIKGYFNLIRNAMDMDQEARVDELSQMIVINVYESILSVNGFDKFVSFSELQDLAHPGEKVIEISYIKNFNREIPVEIVNLKKKADELCVFDNYCVMYYDPSGKTYAKTEEAKRDPILFGLINHSEKLYYVGDWIDDKCDLTIDKIAEKSMVETL